MIECDSVFYIAPIFDYKNVPTARIEAIKCKLPRGHCIDHVSTNTKGEVIEWV